MEASVSGISVRVCGPNLRNQSMGTFHVHEASCRDLKNYGMDRREGGDAPGEREMLVEDATVIKVVYATYADQIRENPDDDLDSYIQDFHFFPCCESLEMGVAPGGEAERADEVIGELLSNDPPAQTRAQRDIWRDPAASRERLRASADDHSKSERVGARLELTGRDLVGTALSNTAAAQLRLERAVERGDREPALVELERISDLLASAAADLMLARDMLSEDWREATYVGRWSD